MIGIVWGHCNGQCTHGMRMAPRCAVAQSVPDLALQNDIAWPDATGVHVGGHPLDSPGDALAHTFVCSIAFVALA